MDTDLSACGNAQAGETRMIFVFRISASWDVSVPAAKASDGLETRKGRTHRDKRGVNSICIPPFNVWEIQSYVGWALPTNTWDVVPARRGMNPRATALH